MSNEHEHTFEATYQRVNGEIVLHNPCKCAGCDQLIFLEYEDYKFIATLVPQHPQITYTVTLAESDKS